MKDQAADIADQVRDLIKYAADAAEERIWADTKSLAEIAFGPDHDCLYVCLPGVDSKNKSNALPLTIEVRDFMTGEAVYSFDPVADILDAYGETQEAAERMEEAILTLEAGIQRLRNEAERLKAQS